MLLGLAKIISCPGGVVPFETELDLHEMTFGGCKPVSEPVRAVGQVRNTAGVLELTAMLTTTLHGVCDRCAAPFVREVSYPVEAILTADADSGDYESPWVFPLEDDHADLDDILTTAFVLNMDSKLLCREDCKGVCFRCGANLNEAACTCQPEKEPRFAILQQLLDKK